MKQFLLVILFACLVGTSSLKAADQPADMPHKKAVLIPLNGVISPRMEAFFERKIEHAGEMGASLVILEIDSPGGYLESSLNMAMRVKSLEWAHTVAFVPREALSGAAIIALGCDDIYIASSARLGDAGPVFQGPDALFRHAPEKIRSDLARRVRDLASATGRPPALAEAMVDMDLVVYRVVNSETGESSFMSDPEIQASDHPERWEKGAPVLESREDRFLEVNGQRAVELQLATKVVNDRDQLLQQFSLEQPVAVLAPSSVDTAVYLLNLPVITGLIFVVGLIALYVEFSAPGISLGGLIAGLCFALFFWSRFLGGTAGWLEVLLVLAGIAFIGVELLILPGFGLAGITGGLMLLVGVVMASQTHLIPESPREMNQLATSMLVLCASGIIFAVAAAVLTRYYGSLPVLNRLVLQSPRHTTTDASEPSSKSPATPHSSVSVGDWGVAASPLRPAGTARFDTEYVDVVTDGSFVESKQQVRVIKIVGNRVVVRQVEDSD